MLYRMLLPNEDLNYPVGTHLLSYIHFNQFNAKNVYRWKTKITS